MQFSFPLNPTSVYEAVSNILTRRGWRGRRTTQPTGSLSLVLHALNQDVEWAKLSSGQLVNFYRGIKTLTNKANLAKCLESSGESSVAPASFCLTSGAKEGADGRENLIMDHSAATGRGESPVWIAKSSVGAKGENIKISRNPMELIDHVDRLANGKAWVIQRYLDNPLLLQPGGRKFDMRIWVLVDPLFRGYAYKEGVLRTCSKPFSLSNLDDAVVHLSNHCVQESLAGDNFSKHEIGNEMFFSEFEERLERDSPHLSLWGHIWPQICTLVSTTLSSVKEKMANIEGGRFRSFQFIGYDIMLTSDGKAWLLEANAAPAAAAALLPEIAEAIVNVAIEPFADLGKENVQTTMGFVKIGDCFPGTKFQRVI